jgi:hypothetical protein
MHASKAVALAGLSLLAVVAPAGAGPGAGRAKSIPDAPAVDPANFQTVVDHPYFPLVPGTRWSYRETAGGKTSDNEITVLTETKVVQGVTCTVVHDVVSLNGVIKEDTNDWYAQDRKGNVWYFGEDTKEYFPHGRLSTEGSWEAGVQGGRAGIFMLATPTVGETYRQEYRKGVAEDVGQVVSVNEAVAVPFGSFTGSVKTKDWSLLEAGHEYKWYAKGVGLVRSESSAHEIAVLVAVKRP